jgi:hypothetical protein
MVHVEYKMLINQSRNQKVAGKITKGLQTSRIDKTYKIFKYNINRLPNRVTRHKKKIARTTIRATVINA